MQPRDRGIDLGRIDAGGDDQPDGLEAIRERQRRRRDAVRTRSDIEAILATPDEEEEDETPPGPPPSRVWIVFRSTRWNDPGGSLRESDSLVGVYASEEGARRIAAQLNKETAAAAGEGDAWYQPYAVES